MELFSGDQTMMFNNSHGLAVLNNLHLKQVFPNRFIFIFQTRHVYLLPNQPVENTKDLRMKVTEKNKDENRSVKSLFAIIYLRSK